MGIFKIKYLLASLAVHSTVVTLLLFFKNPNEKAETSMLITEVIKIQDTSVLNTVNDLKVKKKESFNTKITDKKNSPEKIILKTEISKTKLEISKLENEKKTSEFKKTLIKEKTIEDRRRSDKKSTNNKITQNKDSSEANYKIGSINNPHPPYPIIARKKGFQGALTLLVFVNHDGTVKRVSVKKSSGHQILDKISKETIKKWIFIPAKRMGLPVESNIQVPIKFVLTE